MTETMIEKHERVAERGILQRRIAFQRKSLRQAGRALAMWSISAKEAWAREAVYREQARAAQVEAINMMATRRIEQGLIALAFVAGLAVALLVP